MSKRIQALAHQVFGKASVDDCDLQELTHLVQQYPYFAPAQFLLLEKLKQADTEAYNLQLQKAILYYHDPLTFQDFISSDQFNTELNFDEEVALEETHSRDETVSETEDPYDPAPEVVDDTNSENKLPLITEETLPQQTPVQVEEVAEPVNNFETTDDSSDNGVEEMKSTDLNEDDVENRQLPELKLPEIDLSEPVKESALTFEPFHTVDYFASQGIKVSSDEAPADKFGKQLKSFTEWLKTMKRLPPTETAPAPAGSQETKVHHLAQHSIDESEVVTEAMAEVWLKQGNTLKALEVYNKLSLLNPSKSAYFATKIEKIKHS